MKLKESVLIKMNEPFTFGGDGILRYQDRMCVQDMDDLWTKVVAQAHSSKYLIHQGSTKIYHDLKKIYQWDSMKKDIGEYVGRFPNGKLFKVELFKNGGLTQVIKVLTWKWEAINMDFVVCVSMTRRQH